MTFPVLPVLGASTLSDLAAYFSVSAATFLNSWTTISSNVVTFCRLDDSFTGLEPTLRRLLKIIFSDSMNTFSGSAAFYGLEVTFYDLVTLFEMNKTWWLLFMIRLELFQAGRLR